VGQIAEMLRVGFFKEVCGDEDIRVQFSEDEDIFLIVDFCLVL
jgi:hypothetical protein